VLPINHNTVGDANNRWFDKLSEIIVFANGRAGFSGEHSPLDAIATAALSGHLLSSSKKVYFPTFPYLTPIYRIIQ
jgi:hypothetical protein